MESIRIKKSESSLLRKISRKNRGIMMTETGMATGKIIETAIGRTGEDIETEATEEKEAKRERGEKEVTEEIEEKEETEEKEGIGEEMGKEEEEGTEIETTILTANTKKEENAQEGIETETEKRKNMLTNKPAKLPIIKKSTKRKLWKIKTVNFSLLRTLYQKIS